MEQKQLLGHEGLTALGVWWRALFCWAVRLLWWWCQWYPQTLSKLNHQLNDDMYYNRSIGKQKEQNHKRHCHRVLFSYMFLNIFVSITTTATTTTTTIIIIIIIIRTRVETPPCRFHSPPPRISFDQIWSRDDWRRQALHAKTIATKELIQQDEYNWSKLSSCKSKHRSHTLDGIIIYMMLVISGHMNSLDCVALSVMACDDLLTVMINGA